MAPNAPILGQIVQLVISVSFVACYRLHFFFGRQRNSCHSTLTSTGCSEKLTTKTKHIPALFWARQVDSKKKSNRKIGPFSRSSFLLVLWAWASLGPSLQPSSKYNKNYDLENGPLHDLIFVWELILNTYRGLGYAQFGWSNF